ncbi:hypothetical protein CPB86DRAFT_802954 [Serendipita vermifera]|nr:hypothetical protein CPB86DRAFT_802954 [Serendipita vermifera]
MHRFNGFVCIKDVELVERSNFDVKILDFGQGKLAFSFPDDHGLHSLEIRTVSRRRGMSWLDSGCNVPMSTSGNASRNLSLGRIKNFSRLTPPWRHYITGMDAQRCNVFPDRGLNEPVRKPIQHFDFQFNLIEFESQKGAEVSAKVNDQIR